MKKLCGAAVAVIWLCVACPVSGLAATTNVIVGFNGLHRFSPTNTTINAGDTVVWTWAGTFHSTTSGTNGVAGDDNGVPSGLWDSSIITALPHTFTNTFPVAGNFSYYCRVHYSSGMTGAVIVTSGNIPPTVAITNPANGATFSAPADLTLQATASEDGGSVTNVQFLVGANILTNETTPPFSATTNNLAAGDYMLSAIASDANGVTATNSVSIRLVTPVTVALTNAAAFSGTNFQFSYLANTGLSYVVQLATNLAPANWISLATNVAASNPVVFVDTRATNHPAFYRVGRLPNP